MYTCVQVKLPEFDCLVADFGLSTALSKSVGTKTRLCGTPGFQCPEQLKGSPLSEAWDTYAFGGVLTMLFTEAPLWPGLSPYQILYQVTVRSEHPELGGVPEEIQAICKACFNDIQHRPPMSMVLSSLIGST